MYVSNLYLNHNLTIPLLCGWDANSNSFLYTTVSSLCTVQACVMCLVPPSPPLSVSVISTCLSPDGLPPHPRRVGLLLESEMDREDGDVRGQRPDVKIVYTHHPGQPGEVLSDPVIADPGGGSL